MCDVYFVRAAFREVQVLSSQDLHTLENIVIRSIFIIDEAQDYLLEELQAIINLCKAWQKQNHNTYLWILGDLNQRIQPVNFYWGDLHLKDPLNLLYRNYLSRNSNIPSKLFKHNRIKQTIIM